MSGYSTCLGEAIEELHTGMAMSNAKGPGKVAPPRGRLKHQGAAAMAEDLVRDAALSRASDDRLNHEPIVGVVADMTLAAEPPVNIALFGSWGSGKSSFFAALGDVLRQRDPSVRVARYDAWKYGGRALKQNFIQSVAEQLGAKDADFTKGVTQDQDKSELDLAGYVGRNWIQLLLGLLLALAVALLWLAIVTGGAWLVDRDAGLSVALRAGIAGVGSVLSIALAAILIGPKVMESAVVKVSTPAPQTDDQFADRFTRLVQKVTKGKAGRLVVFIDELDRCAPDDVVATLIDLKTFLEVERCIFIVGADREALESALQKVPQSTPLREDDPYYSTPGAFLDKIFQHQVALPPLRPQALTKYARELVAQQGGIWQDLRDAEPADRLFLEVVYALVPVHVRSPRRVKILLNHYATTVRIAQARGINWIERASEIAVFTVLQIEFPHLAADLVKSPMLLGYVRGEPVPAGAEALKRLVNAYADGGGAMDAAEPAGPLLDDGGGTEGEDVDGQGLATARANRTLTSQLRSYLGKVAAQRIADPRPDLFFLQSAGTGHGIEDPELGNTIDLAADLSPDEVVEQFAEQASTVRATAVHLLAQQAENERGPGRESIVESICRLVETIDTDDLLGISEVVAPVVVSSAQNGGLRDGAIPGALTLSVVTRSTPLVENLLKRHEPDKLAELGLLDRFSSALTFATGKEEELIQDLIAETYEHHPQALHESLSRLPVERAARLWQRATDCVDDALIDLGRELTAATQAATQAATAATRRRPQQAAETTPEPTSIEDPADRYADLLTAVESRTDDAENLISGVLRLGQLHSDASVRELVRDREDHALERISNPALRTEHALIGMARAPIDDCAWWEEYATSEEADAVRASAAVTRLLRALPEADAGLAAKITTAATKAMVYLDGSHADDVVKQITATLVEVGWSSTLSADDTARRKALYSLAERARNIAESSTVDEALASDLIGSIDSSAGEPAVGEAINRLRDAPESTSRMVEAKLEEREVTGGATDALAMRLRIAARRRYAGAAFDVAEILAAATDDENKHLVAEWLGLNPHVDDVITAIATLMPDGKSLGGYAARANLGDRSRLWAYLETTNADLAVLRRVGDAGVDGEAVKSMDAKIEAATSQPARDDLTNRLLTAHLTDPAAKRAGIELALRLLSTDILGNGLLAARVAISVGEAPHGTVSRLRDAFDAYVSRKGQKLTKAQQDRLVDARLLTRRKKKKGLARLMDGIASSGSRN